MSKKDYQPVPLRDRNLSTMDLTLIWFGAAIAITEVWAGGLPQLTRLGLGLGLIAIIVGRLIGNGLMGAMAKVGSDTGLPTMVLTRPAFGVRGSYLPALFNILQLLGWTGWMLFVGFLYMDKLAGFVGWPTSGENGGMKYLWIIVLGVLCTLWAYGGSRFWKVAQRISAVLLFGLTIAMTVVVIQQYGFSNLLSGGISFDAGGLLSGADLVIAMSISWLPLVADYSRYGRKSGSGAKGTFWGYFIGGTWMYAVGLLVAVATGTDAPDQMVIQVLGDQGLAWAVLAVALVLVSTVTTTFLDIFSTVVSTQNLWPRFPQQAGNLVIGAIGTVIAMCLDVFAYEGFLLAIGAIFLPAFTVVLYDYYFVARQRIMVSQVNLPGGAYWYRGGFNWRAILAWFIGFLVYDWARGWESIGFFLRLSNPEFQGTAFVYGASIPCIIATAFAYWALVRIFRSGVGKKKKK